MPNEGSWSLQLTLLFFEPNLRGRIGETMLSSDLPHPSHVMENYA
jgi:hypothetical protein